ncbi:hypothetical protein PMAYCL1PPCAC_07050, partial [Pristionchus mayeri]
PPGWLLPLLFSLTSAHIRLSFPPSFSFSDALSNDDSSLCNGSPPEGSPSTYLLAGSTIEIEWSSSVPHAGGIRIDLIDSNNKVVKVFKDLSAPHNISSPWHRLVLPSSLSCSDCLLRVSHSAAEISHDRLYLSCALVSIGKSIPDGDTCNRKGKRVNGVCLCNEGFEGSHCQHSFECDDDVDCGKGGSCHSLSPSTRVCYCPPGKKGRRCEQHYTKDVTAFDESLYQMKEAGPNKIYWRIVNEEIEVVLRSPSPSWSAIGWKPLVDHGECAATLSKLSSMHEETSSSSSPLPSSSSPLPLLSPSTRRPPSSSRSPSSLRPSTPSPSGHECGVNEEWSDCPEERLSCEASCDWTLGPDSIPTCKQEGCGPSRCVCKEGFVRASANSTKCIPFDACNPADHSCGANETWAQCGTACEPSCSNMYDTAPCPASCEKAACTCADNYVRHNGECVYWGDCPDLDEHFAFSSDDNLIGDISNKSATESATSAPLSVHVPPTSCPVNETLNECGKACETDCTSIFIREQCSSCGSSDCSCIQGYARSNGRCVYWGDCPADQMNLQKGASKGTPRVTGSNCKGEFGVPAGCTVDCDYRVMWNYMEESDEVEFALETKTGANSWSGVAFGENPSMEKADVYVVKSMNGKVSIDDMWSEGKEAVKDMSRDIAVPTPMGSHVDGVLRARFKRRRVSRDKKNDVDFGDDHCVYMIFPVEGGKIQRDGSFSLHSSTPLTSHTKICFRSCAPKPKEQKKEESSSCVNEFRHPVGCIDSTCEYTARWEYNSTGENVRFEISARDLGRWTGIGFSKNGEMSNADIYTGWVYEGKAYVTDRFAYGRQLPAIDPADRSDIADVGGRIEDDVQTIWFTRPVVTRDSLTDLPLDKCYYFLFPVGGGRVLARKSSDFHNPRTPIGYHDIEAPHVSPTKICLCDQTGSPIPTQPPAVRRRRQAPFVGVNPFEDTPTSPHSDPMACVDMVMGVSDGRGGRVVDMFSVGTSSPLEDSSLGGNDSLLAASAVYSDGISTISFRKKLRASDPTDISITPGPMQVLWANGVDPARYRHVTGGAPIKADPSFFSPHSFKYHSMDNRGIITIDFFGSGDHEEASGMSSDCHGSMSFPHGCSGEECDYSVSWESDGETASFSLQADISPLQWTALGFSPNGAMAQSDVVVVSILEDSKVTVIDQFMTSYGRPSIDEDQDIFAISTKYSNGRVYANFSRDLKGVDGHDVSLDECRYFLYTPVPSSLDKSGEMRKHSSSPTPSAGKICLSSCSTLPATGRPTISLPPTGTSTISFPPTTQRPEKPQKDTKETMKETKTTPKETKVAIPSSSHPTLPSTTTTSSPPLSSPSSTSSSVPSTTSPKLSMPPLHDGPPRPIPKARYALKIRIINREYVPDLANEKSEYYQSFTKDLKSAVDKALSLKWKDVEMGRVLSYSKGSVVALVEVDALHSSPRPIEIKSVIEETAVRGAINGVHVEATTVTVQQLPVEQPSKEIEEVMMTPHFLSQMGWLIGSILLLLFFSAVCICVFCKCRRVSHQFSPMGSQKGKTYSDIPYKTSSSSVDPYPAYPMPAGYTYGTLNLKKTSTATSTAGFDNKAYQHQRHFSQATTASTKNSPPPGGESTPRGIGETNYQEWLREVASKPASQEHEESLTVPRPPSAAYSTYPNEPNAYYSSMGGEHRTGTTSRNLRH